jgi:hypothetical protein
MSPATIGIPLLLLLIAAGSSFAGWKAAIIGRYVIGLALLALFLTVGAGCVAIVGSVGAGCVAIVGFRSWAGRLLTDRRFAVQTAALTL